MPLPPSGPSTSKFRLTADRIASADTISRPDSPATESSTRQGRRNHSLTGVQLLDPDDALSTKLETCLAHIFAKYVEPPFVAATSDNGLLRPPPNAFLTDKGLDRWAKDTNGQPFPQETKEELKEFLDVTEDGKLTFQGFLQIYQLQTENDDEETWRDLSSHGFDRDLNLVSTRREDEETPNPK